MTQGGHGQDLVQAFVIGLLPQFLWIRMRRRTPCARAPGRVNCGALPGAQPPLHGAHLILGQPRSCGKERLGHYMHAPKSCHVDGPRAALCYGLAEVEVVPGDCGPRSAPEVLVVMCDVGIFDLTHDLATTRRTSAGLGHGRLGRLNLQWGRRCTLLILLKVILVRALGHARDATA